jgi:hypothetical protein
MLECPYSNVAQGWYKRTNAHARTRSFSGVCMLVACGVACSADFDDGANALWSLYGKEAQTHDEAQFQSLSADMEGVPTFVRVSRILEFSSSNPCPCRLACLLPFSLRSSSTVFKIYNLILHSKRSIMTSNLSRFSPRSHRKSRLSITPQVPIPSIPPPPTPHSIHRSRKSE